MDRAKTNSATILLVEDEESVLKLATHVLEMQGYRVLASPQSESALRIARKTTDPIHLLLTDVRMEPHMSGCRLAQYLRPMHPEMKIMYMTGFPASEIVQKEVAHGLASLIRKPFTPTVLLERI